MRKKIVLFIGAIAVVTMAATNVNVAYVKEKFPNVSLAQARALARDEGGNPPVTPPADPCALNATTLQGIYAYKMMLTNTNLIGGIAIRNNPSTGALAYGLDVEQSVKSYRTSIAVRAHALGTTQTGGSKAYGVYAVAGNAAHGYNYGVFAGLTGCGNGAALFATSNASSNQHVNGKYAGYFQGDVHTAGKMSIGATNSSYNLYVSGNVGVTGSLLMTSDARRKTNVKKLESALDKIAKLRPVTYNFKPDDLSKYYELVPDSVKIANDEHLREYFGLGKGTNSRKKHIGFIAQELEEVIPELVHSDKEDMLSVDYLSLVPVLTGAIQEQNKTIQEQGKIIREQNKTIDKMNEAIELLSKRLEVLEGTSEKVVAESGEATVGKPAESVLVNNFSFTLYPNPASSASVVTVDYTMHVNAPIAIELYNMMGQKVRQILPNQQQQAGNYSAQVAVSGLNVGTYIVRAISGNQVVSKQLVVNY